MRSETIACEKYMNAAITLSSQAWRANTDSGMVLRIIFDAVLANFAVVVRIDVLDAKLCCRCQFAAAASPSSRVSAETMGWGFGAVCIFKFLFHIRFALVSLHEFSRGSFEFWWIRCIVDGRRWGYEFSIRYLAYLFPIQENDFDSGFQCVAFSFSFPFAM